MVLICWTDMRKERGIDRQSADISKRLDGRLALKRSRQKDFRICQAFCLDNGHAFTRMFELDETTGEGDGLGQSKQEAVASIPQLLANVRQPFLTKREARRTLPTCQPVSL